MGEVKAASSLLRLRPRTPGHWGIDSTSGRVSGDEKMELVALQRCDESPCVHGGGEGTSCSQGHLLRGWGSSRGRC